ACLEHETASIPNTATTTSARRIDEDPFLIMILVPSVIETLAPVLRSHRGPVVHRDLGQRDVAGELVELVSGDRRRRDGDVGRPEVRHPWHDVRHHELVEVHPAGQSSLSGHPLTPVDLCVDARHAAGGVPDPQARGLGPGQGHGRGGRTSAKLRACDLVKPTSELLTFPDGMIEELENSGSANVYGSA